ncbi:glycerol kinase GlpK [Microbacterium sp. ASV49]|uniref:ATP:glycerol 3-phosphotransferase n=1 Tax=Microbacterium candidum TaxID=3041922 RepID=A0ABT7N243_9MICO|nr:glycerol kinase GlpK [Microbacterium sp. ASV49]MDL9980743.1 glycerol kinase GlpK [Microbacterium sp. ASV49]
MDHVLALDHGTTSTRAMVFDATGSPVSTSQIPHAQFTPQPGWVEHDALEVWHNARHVIAEALDRAALATRDVAAVGIANQRETTVVWDRRDGRPVAPAIVWQDVRTAQQIDGIDRAVGGTEVRRRTGLQLSSYFSVTKLMWILDNVPGVREAADAGHLMFGTMDTWLLWNLTGGSVGGVHSTDVTNASRTALMDIRALRWDDDLLAALRIPRSLLPEIHPSADRFGLVRTGGPLDGVAVAALVGDQQAALYGHGITTPGQAKCTYGTGGFVMSHTGTGAVLSDSGLLPTAAFQQAGSPVTYALEGSIAVAGSLFQWLRDRLRVLDDVRDSERLAASVEDSAGIVLVPAFSGLFAPHWRPDARGAILGLTSYAGREHIVRAGLDAIAHQVADVSDAAQQDSGLRIDELSVDGGATSNALLMQIQADILGIPVRRPRMLEMTAYGAALAAGVGIGLWADRQAAPTIQDHDSWTPTRTPSWRTATRAQWADAVQRSLGWAGSQAHDPRDRSEGGPDGDAVHSSRPSQR